MKRSNTFDYGQLEARQLMAADIQLADGVLFVEGTNSADQVQVEEFVKKVRRFETSRWGYVSYLVDVETVRATVKNAQGQILVTDDFERVDVDQLRIHTMGGDDTIANETSLPSRIESGSGDDLVIGGSASDEVFAGYGKDIVYGRGGHDKLNGQGNNDFMHGGAGNDVMDGGSGNDVMFGGSGHDSLYGREGHDNMHGDNFDSNGFASDYYHTAYQGEDPWDFDEYFLEDSGFDGNDTMYGNSGNDIMTGGSGRDFMNGGSGSDKLRGNDGNDTLVSGSDYYIDQLIGGDGDDKFYFHGEDLVNLMPGHAVQGKANVVSGTYQGYYFFRE